MNTQVHAPRTDTALAHVLAIDDDPIIRAAIADYLGQHEFRVTAVADGRAMQAVLAGEVVDLVVLDLKLQAEDGMALARRLREESAIPIIMLTGRREEADRVMGLELGADDYLTKPFSPRELVARVRVVLRRATSQQTEDQLPDELSTGPFMVDFRSHEVRLHGQLVNLTPTEFKLLETLVREPGRVFSRLELVKRVFGLDYEGFERTVDVHIMNLRKKIEAHPNEPAYLQTVYGVGYKFRKEGT